MVIRIVSGCGLALLLGLYAERAAAGQVFLCEDGKSVQISSADLEEAKRFDPCVARYFGGSIDATVIPLPVRRPAQPGIRADVAAVARALRTGRSEPAPETATNASNPVASDAKTATAPKAAAAVSRSIKATQQPSGSTFQRGLAALGSGDYRNVRVINGLGSDAWFRHQK